MKKIGKVLLIVTVAFFSLICVSCSDSSTDSEKDFNPTGSWEFE